MSEELTSSARPESVHSDEFEYSFDAPHEEPAASQTESVIPDSTEPPKPQESPPRVEETKPLRDESTEAEMWVSISKLQERVAQEELEHTGGLRSRDTDLSAISIAEALRQFEARDLSAEAVCVLSLLQETDSIRHKSSRRKSHPTSFWRFSGSFLDQLS